MNNKGMLPRAVAVAGVVAGVLFTGCAQNMAAAEYPNGTYTGSSAPDEDGAVGTVTFTITDSKVTEASFVVRDEDGTVHDENYGLSKSTGMPIDETFYRRAQAAVKAEREYVSQFIEVGDADEVDIIAGASVSHRQFIEAVTDALRKSDA